MLANQIDTALSFAQLKSMSKLQEKKVEIKWAFE